MPEKNHDPAPDTLLSTEIPASALAQMSAADVAALIGMPLERWPGSCYGVALRVVECFRIPNTHAVYGHYLGPVAHSCALFSRRTLIRHGWILAGDGLIIDPTRWVFEAAEPYIASFPRGGTGTAYGDYDEGGEQWIRSSCGPPPVFRGDEKRFPPPDDPGLARFLKRYMNARGRYAPDPAGNLSLGQMFWIAKQPYSDLGAHGQTLYRWLLSLGLRGLIPIDFQRRAAREGLLGGDAHA